MAGCRVAERDGFGGRPGAGRRADEPVETLRIVGCRALADVEVEVVGRIGPGDRGGQDAIVRCVEVGRHIDDQIEGVAVLSLDANPAGERGRDRGDLGALVLDRPSSRCHSPGARAGPVSSRKEKERGQEGHERKTAHACLLMFELGVGVRRCGEIRIPSAPIPNHQNAASAG